MRETDATASCGDSAAASFRIAPASGLPIVDVASYEIGEELAQGGMGRIVAARDRRLGRPVAIKELLVPTLAHRRRFEREVRISARLQHPAIVSVIEAGQWPNGEPFLAMKLVVGRSLRRAIDERSTLAQRLGLLANLAAVADALAYAHAQRIVHRDLKPANVLVGDFGETVVIDWGLAKELGVAGAEPPGGAIEADDGETVAGAVIGTPAYMPPEQARGEPVDERADVYALGAMLYYLLCGAPPFTGSTAEQVLAAVLASPPPALQSRQDGIPDDLAAIVTRAMARDPAARYPSAAELADDLRRFRTGRLVSARDYGARDLVRRWLRRHRAPVLVAAALLAVLVAGAVMSVDRIVEERDTAMAAQAAGERLIEYALTARRETNLYEQPLGGLGDAIIDYYALAGQEGDDELAARARILAGLSRGELEQGNLRAARRGCEAGLAIREHLAAREPDDPDRPGEAALLHVQLAEIEKRAGRGAAARERYQVARALLEATLRDRRRGGGRWRGELAQTLRRLGDLELALGDVDAALASLEASRAEYARLAADAPSDPDRQGDLVAVQAHLARARRDQGDLAAAMRLYDDSLALAERLAGGRSPARRAMVATDLGPRLVIFDEIEGRAVLEGDILLGGIDELSPRGARPVRVALGGRWSTGVVPYEIDPRLAAPQRQAIDAAVQHCDGSRNGAHGTLYRFRPRTDEPDFIRFVPTRLPVCLSHVGRTGGAQEIVLGSACTGRALVHAIGHALGLWHEDSRADRDDYIRIRWQNGSPGAVARFVVPFPDGRDRFPYDHASILHADALEQSRERQPTVVRLDGAPLAPPSDALHVWDTARANALFADEPSRPRTALISASSGLCVDVAYSYHDRFTRIVQHACDGERSQRWYVAPVVADPRRVAVINDATGSCLVIGDGDRHAAPVNQWPCNGDSAQQFELIRGPRGTQFRSVGAGWCLDAGVDRVEPFRLTARECQSTRLGQQFLTGF